MLHASHMALVEGSSNAMTFNVTIVYGAAITRGTTLWFESQVRLLTYWFGNNDPDLVFQILF